MNTCPICNEGHLKEHINKNVVEYAGQTASLDVNYSVCTSCGSEQTSAVQAGRNKKYMLDFKNEVDINNKGE